MAWIEGRKRKNGETTFWVRDKRNGRQISIFGGLTRAEAETKLEQYRVRRDLEKEGYNDVYDTDAFIKSVPKKG